MHELSWAGRNVGPCIAKTPPAAWPAVPRTRNKKSCVVEFANIRLVKRFRFKMDTMYKPALGGGGLTLSLKKMAVGLITRIADAYHNNKIKSIVFS